MTKQSMHTSKHITKAKRAKRLARKSKERYVKHYCN